MLLSKLFPAVFFLLISAQLFADADLARLQSLRILKCGSLRESILGGKLTNLKPATAASVRQTRDEIEGLDSAGVIAWSPTEISLFNTKLVRYHDADAVGFPMPKFDKAQPLGPAVVDAREIRFSQLDCKNDSDGGYSVISNARALRDGTLKVESLPKLRVWRDADGRIWTLDHRRLAAMRLSGSVNDIPVEFVDEATVNAQRFKFTTRSEGESIFVRVEKPGQENVAIVIANDRILRAEGPAVQARAGNPGDRATYRELIDKYEPQNKNQWLKNRGATHMGQLRRYAFELSQSLKALGPTTLEDFRSTYAAFGEVSVRTKSESSILAKLLKKDFEAFSNGKKGVTSLKDAVAAIGDSVGARVSLKADAGGRVDPSSIESYVTKLISDIKGGMRITEISNYRAAGPEGLPYLSDAQIERIMQADREYRATLLRLKNEGRNVIIPPPMIVKSGKAATSETGYTSFHVNVQYQSGVQAELQLRGPLVNKATEYSHFFYDMQNGKTLNPDLAGNKDLVAAQLMFKELSPEKKKSLLRYVGARMTLARRAETGAGDLQAPTLPQGVPAELSFERLIPHLVHER